LIVGNFPDGSGLGSTRTSVFTLDFIGAKGDGGGEW